MIERKVIVPLAALLLMAAPPVLAQTAPAETKASADTGAMADEAEAADESWIDRQIPGQVSGTVAFTTDYVFRGISNTDNNPAAQAGLEYSYDTGFYDITPYFGVWGSNVDFNDGDEATVELDWSFGFRGTLPIADQEIGWNLGGIYYSYPGAGKVGGQSSNYDYWEIPVGLTYAPLDFLEFGLTNYYSPDFFGATGKANYINGKVTVTPPNPYVDFALFAGMGHQYIEHSKDYNDWTLGATVTVKKIDFTFQYTDTNLTQADLGGNKLSDARFVFTVGFAF